MVYVRVVVLATSHAAPPLTSPLGTITFAASIGTQTPRNRFKGGLPPLCTAAVANLEVKKRLECKRV
eukprot:6460146-Amphidinium_carterae.2